MTPPPVPPLDDTACTQQALSQPLLGFGDLNYYVLAPGGTFSSTGGWYLASGAKIAQTVQPDGTVGGVLSLSGKAQATSPVMCITNAYPMARVFSRNPTGTGTGNASLNIQYYTAAKGWSPLKDTGSFTGAKKNWQLSGELPVAPANRAGWQQVRFTLYAANKTGTFLIDDFWIDPAASR